MTKRRLNLWVAMLGMGCVVAGCEPGLVGGRVTPGPDRNSAAFTAECPQNETQGECQDLGDFRAPGTCFVQTCGDYNGHPCLLNGTLRRDDALCKEGGAKPNATCNAAGQCEDGAAAAPECPASTGGPCAAGATFELVSGTTCHTQTCYVQANGANCKGKSVNTDHALCRTGGDPRATCGSDGQCKASSCEVCTSGQKKYTGCTYQTCVSDGSSSCYGASSYQDHAKCVTELGDPAAKCDKATNTCVRGSSGTCSCAGIACGSKDLCGNTCVSGGGCCNNSCTGIQCGDKNGCGKTCYAEGGQCTPPPVNCTPTCAGKTCGQKDSCGRSTCAAGVPVGGGTCTAAAAGGCTEGTWKCEARLWLGATYPAVQKCVGGTWQIYTACTRAGQGCSGCGPSYSSSACSCH
ncbi:MAG: hypothetical protein IT371_07855 [Deltaproteobacteria bacterium]|nr:hypothetical protein [Deltaproteobacteria bacterium]